MMTGAGGWPASGGEQLRPIRRAGVLVPLFSLVSSRSWGIGEIGDIAGAAAWLRQAGQRVLQLLPINETPPAETSPYAALSAMAIDPQFVSMDAVDDFCALGGEASLDPDVRDRLAALRASPRVAYTAVRAVKHLALRSAFARFRDVELAGGTRRAAAFRAWARAQQWWLDDYALFRALHARHGERAWTDWPEPLQRRDPAALVQAREDLADDILYRQYVQWLADTQWHAARQAADGIALFGDLPFMVSGDSADVWARQDEFRLDASVGVPPDAFSEQGQDWGLPAYRWEVLAARDFDWLRHRARRNADLFDGYRLDHVVGFYRTYCRPLDGGPAAFSPPDEEGQLALGERVLGVFREPGTEIVAEDLGTVPDFVRRSLAALSVPGYCVLRWERYWDVEGQPFRDPVDYPTVSVATSGTHDTETLAVWWEQAEQAERQAVLAIPSVRDRLAAADRGALAAAPGFPDAVRDALLEALYGSASSLLIVPIQDLCGWRDRINEPGTVSGANWTWRLPWPVDALATHPAARDCADRLRFWAGRYGR